MYLRVSLTDRCNLRCVYCLDEQARFAAERCRGAELRRLVELVVAAGAVHKIRITGGEPTLDPDLVTQVAHAARLVPEVGMTTNGLLLEPLLEPLQAAGLRRLNISLDAVDPDGFRRFSRREGLEQVLSSIRRAKALGFAPLKVNAVATGESNVAALVDFARFEGIHLRFIELMAIGPARDWQAHALISAYEIRRRLWEQGISLIEARARDEPTSRVYTLPGCDPNEVSIGFIPPSSQPFCATGDRLRLTSQGTFHTCLFDEAGVDLLTPLRAGDEAEVQRRVQLAVAAKRPPQHFIRSGSMAAIGG
jgi:cyclic pyranopterin phosphate synthase